MAYLYIENKITSFAKLTDMGGNWEFSSQKNGYGWKWGIFYKKILILLDMDLAKRGGVEWVSKFCPVRGYETGPGPHLVKPGSAGETVLMVLTGDTKFVGSAGETRIMGPTGDTRSVGPAGDTRSVGSTGKTEPGGSAGETGPVGSVSKQHVHILVGISPKPKPKTAC